MINTLAKFSKGFFKLYIIKYYLSKLSVEYFYTKCTPRTYAQTELLSYLIVATSESGVKLTFICPIDTNILVTDLASYQIFTHSFC